MEVQDGFSAAGSVVEGDGTERVLKALNHPLRRQIICFAVGARRPVSPVMASKALDENLSNVTYHVKELFKLGVFESDSSRRVRGAVEHFYTPTKSVLDHPMIQAVLAEGGVRPA